MTVTSGQQADYTLALTPEAAQGNFTFTCGTLPTNALCIFNPTTQTLASRRGRGNVMVQIYTGRSSQTVRTEPLPEPPAGWRVAPLLCGLLLLPLALWRRQKVLLLVALSAIFRELRYQLHQLRWRDGRVRQPGRRLSHHGGHLSDTHHRHRHGHLTCANGHPHRRLVSIRSAKQQSPSRYT